MSALMSTLKETFEKIPCVYEVEPPAFCYPGTVLMDDMSEIAQILTKKHLNSIGTHTFGVTSKTDPATLAAEGGFEEAHNMEREYICWLAEKFYKTVAKEKIIDCVDGYFCGGGTEANETGLWIGREYFKNQGVKVDDIVVLMTKATHYSIQKAMHILGLPNLEYVKMNKKFKMNNRSLCSTVLNQVYKGKKAFIVVGTVGTTMYGSVDNIQKINATLQLLTHAHPELKFYVHVDASFGGYTLPFITDSVLVGFENPFVQSIAVDADKMGCLPYPSGVFLCRKNLQNLIKIPVPYIKGHVDSTLCGSRPFVSVACGWWYIHKYGDDWHRQYVWRCLQHRDELAKKLKGIPGIHVLHYSRYVNLLPIVIDFDTDKLPSSYQMRCEEVEIDGKPKKVYKLCIMQHTFKYIDQFVEDLKKASAME